ncbi:MULTISPECIES: glycoside hydrolase family 2 protein [unclassified Nocardioides]|uniref:glycoside hydrolase family 2 protein n=1 Tax=unclassified Nocardioides TaxID=2615069 RepID=UPI00361A2CDF
MRTLTLYDGWTVSPTAGAVPADIAESFEASVPGCVHTDLLVIGAIPDPYLDDGELAVRWMHDVDWRYARELALDPPADGERVDLVLDGVDTVAHVAWGEAELGATANMHRTYRFDLRPHIDGEARSLVVDLRSATAYAQELRERLGARPSAYPDSPFNFVRKMACSFGWDWGPDLRTAGLWRPVRVERWHTARLARVRPLVGLAADGTGTVDLHVDVERSGLDPDSGLRVRASVHGASVEVAIAPGAGSAVLRLEVPDAPVWWPIGYGEQPLVDLDVALMDDVDEELDAWSRRIGFRAVALDTTPDEHGTPFVLVVNGRPVAVRGANWIPDDHFVTRITPDRIARRLDQAVGANLNLLRVWGGGIYESDDFYEACDERGLLVWQDFLLACAAYAEEEPLRSEIVAEARDNVVRLMPHPSLVLWNGGNENLWGHEDWGWKDELGSASWGGRYATELLPDVVAELDPTRPYCDNSPYTPGRAADDVHPNDPDHGTHHQWEVWNRIDYRAYRDEVPRFCSEFGYQAPPAWRTLRDWVHADGGGPLEDAADPIEDPVFLLHQKAADGNEKLARGMAPHLGAPDSFTDWHWATQLQQARAVRYAVEHHRSWWPRTTGSVVWQLNDCWPVTSWAAIDSEERPKPLWFALQQANAPRILAIVERDGGPAIAAVNDTEEPWTDGLDVRRETFAGVPLARASAALQVPARAVQIVPLDEDVCRAAAPAAEVIVAVAGIVRTCGTFAEDVDLDLRPDAVEAVATRVAGGYDVTITARSFAADVTLHPDRVAADATVDASLCTLPAGTSEVLRVRTTADIDPADLVRAPVLRSANDLRSSDALG